MDLTCIRCPMGCAIHVEMENGQVVSVTGNTCPRGAEYAKSEATAPVRTVTSTVRALGGVRPVVAVKTVPDVPKGKIFAVMDAVRALEVKAPVHIGDILCENIADTGFIRIRNRWYPREELTVPTQRIRETIHAWVEPVQQLVPSLEPSK